MKLRFSIIALTVLGLAACDSNSALDTDSDSPETLMAVDIPADPIVGLVGGRPVGAGVTTYYSLRTNSIVSDSASTAWDLALQGTNIYVNGGTSGPGQGGAMVWTGVFEELLEAPETGYRTDSADGLAIPAGSGNGWYNYDPATMVISPIPGRVLVIRTADGRYGKVKIMSYYRGMPDPPTHDSESRYYTFEYVLQTNASRRF